MKWKNYGLWVSIASVLYMVLKDLGLQIDLSHWETYVTAILGILVTLGVISNPENGKWFFNAKIPPSSTDELPTNQLGSLNESTENYNAQNTTSNPIQTTDSSNTEEIPYRRHTPNEK